MKGFFQGLWHFVAGLFSEVKKIEISIVTHVEAGAGGVAQEVKKDVTKLAFILDDKRTFGILWLAFMFVVIFAFPTAHVATAQVSLLLALVLFLGVPLSDMVQMVPGLGSLGILDLVTNKANQGDGIRVLAVVLQLAAMGYDLSPLWNSAVQLQDSIFQLLGGGGVALALVAIWGDHSAVKAAGQGA